MSLSCSACGKELSIDPSARVGRRDSCQHCGADLHCCYNCSFYDQSAYNECRESQAERVLDKDRSNFCDYFSFASGQKAARNSNSKSDTLKDLDDLFD